MQITQQIAGRIAHLAVDIRQLLDNAGPQGDIGGIIHRTHPQPQHIGPVGRLLLFVLAPLHQHGRIDHIAQGFAHLAPLLIQGEAMGEHRFERGLSVDSHRGEQAALEPAPVLIGALQIEISRIIEPRAGDRSARHQSPQHPRPGGARIKPDIHGVGALAPLVGLSGSPRRQQLGLAAFPPHIRTMLGHQRLNVGQTGFIQQHFAGFAVIENRNRHPPGALARDAPIAPVAHHRLDAIAATGGHPAHLLNRR